jgi:hypothetical protein
MITTYVIGLGMRYAKCPFCGNKNISGDGSSLEVTDDQFIRICKCGWKVQVTPAAPDSPYQFEGKEFIPNPMESVTITFTL